VYDIRANAQGPTAAAAERGRARKAGGPRSAFASAPEPSRQPLHHDMLAASIGQGNGVTTVATPFQ